MKNFDDLNNKFNLTEVDSIDDNSLIVVYNNDTLNYIKASVLKNYLGTTPSGELSVTFTADSTVDIDGATYYKANCPGLYNFASRFDYRASGSGGVYIGYVKIGDDTGCTNLVAMPAAEGSNPAMMGPYIAMGEGESAVLMSCLIYGSEWTTGTESCPIGKRDDIFIYPGEYQVSAPFTITFSIEPFTDSGSEGSDQFDGKTIKITTNNSVSYTDNMSQNIKAYYVNIPGIYDALKDKPAGRNCSIKVTNSDGSTENYATSEVYFSVPSSSNKTISIMVGSSDYKYWMTVMSGEDSAGNYASETIKKDNVVLNYSIISGGSEFISDLSRTGYPKTFELTFN